MNESMASEEDLEEIIGEYSARLGIRMPSIVWNTKYESATLVWELLYISPEALESMSVSDLRVEAGYAFARRVQDRATTKWARLCVLAFAISLLATYSAKVNSRPDVMSSWYILVVQLPLLFCVGTILVMNHIRDRNYDRIAFGLTGDVEGMMRFLATKGILTLSGRRVPDDPKVLAKRTTQLERYVESQIVGESKP